MDYVDRMFGRTQTFNPNGLFKFTALSPHVQKHLEKVYLTLTGALLVSALGALFSIVTGLGGLLGVVGFVGCTTWLVSTPCMNHNFNKRYALLAGAAFSQGTTLGPLIGLVLDTHPGVMVTAFLGTASVFACFTAAAVLARRRSWLYLGGTLSACTSAFLVMRLASWIFGSSGLVFSAELYFGLLVFIGYVVFDTQMIVERAYAGEKDHIKHALDLFVDFMAIFTRILIILYQNAEKRESDKKKRRR